MQPVGLPLGDKYYHRWSVRLRWLAVTGTVILVMLCLAAVTLAATRTVGRTVDRLEVVDPVLMPSDQGLSPSR